MHLFFFLFVMKWRKILVKNRRRLVIFWFHSISQQNFVVFIFFLRVEVEVDPWGICICSFIWNLCWLVPVKVVWTLWSLNYHGISHVCCNKLQPSQQLQDPEYFLCSESNHFATKGCRDGQGRECQCPKGWAGISSLESVGTMV